MGKTLGINRPPNSSAVLLKIPISCLTVPQLQIPGLHSAQPPLFRFFWNNQISSSAVHCCAKIYNPIHMVILMCHLIGDNGASAIHKLAI